ncbi:MAG: PAS domain S-box protein [Elusimicrobiota bacterium]
MENPPEAGPIRETLAAIEDAARQWLPAAGALAGAVALGAIAVVAWLLHAEFKDVTITQAQHQMLTTAQSVSRGLENFLEEHHKILEHLSRHPSVRGRARLGRAWRADPSEFYPIPYTFELHRDVAEVLFLLDAEGVVLDRMPALRLKAGADLSKRADVALALKKREGQISGVVRTDSGAPEASILTPVFSDGKFAGVLGWEFDLNNIQERFLGHIAVGRKGYAWMVDRDGIILAHPEREQTGQDVIALRKARHPEYDWSELETIAARMRAGEEGIGAYHSLWWTEGSPERVKKLAAYVPVRFRGKPVWSVGVTMGYSEIAGPVAKHARSVFGLATLAIALLGAAGIAILRARKRRISFEGKIRYLAAISKKSSALLESEERFRSLSETTSDWIWEVDDNGVYTYVNPKVKDLLGYTPKEAIGKTPFDFMPPEEAERVAAEFAAIVHARRPFDGLENVNIHKDGRLITLETSGIPVFDPAGDFQGYRGIDRDITARKNAEEAARLTQLSIDAVDDNIFWLGPDARIFYVNEAACRRLGYTRKELYSMKVFDFDPAFPPEEWHNHWEEIRRRGSFTIESVHRSKDGRVFPVEITVNHVKFAGKEYNCAFARDITERKQAETARQILESQLQQAQKVESLGVLAGGIAHDFNNLLVGILGNADLALTDLPDDSAAREDIEEIKKAAIRASELSNQMLAYSGKGRFVVRPISLNEMLQEMFHLLETCVPVGTALRRELADDVPAVDADSGQLRQVVTNLVTNAADAMGDAGGEIVLRTGVDEVSRAHLQDPHNRQDLPEGPYAYVEVSDTGCGMDEQTMSRMFDPFFTTKFTGRGLGLSTVLGIVRGHKGAVKVRSEPGKGTTFKVLLPSASQPAAPLAEPGFKPKDARPLAGTVLVADDERVVRNVTKRILEQAGLTVLLADNGRKAVDMFREDAGKIVLVLLDLTMPVMDGAAAFREIRRIRPDAKVILCSGYDEKDAVGRFAGQGLAGFLHKPFRLESLMEAVRAVL